VDFSRRGQKERNGWIYGNGADGSKGNVVKIANNEHIQMKVAE